MVSAPLGFSHLLSGTEPHRILCDGDIKKKRKERKGKEKKELDGEQDTVSMLSVCGPREALVS